MKKFLSDPLSNSIALALALVVLVVAGLSRAAPAAPLVPLSLGGGTTNFSSLAVSGDLAVTGRLTTTTLISQNVGFNATAASTLVTTTVTGPLTATTLIMGADSFSGAMKAVTFANAANGVPITYSMSTTPTSIVCWGGSIYTPTIQNSTIGPITATLLTSTTVPNLYCLVGR
jgi:hypothetical protein